MKNVKEFIDKFTDMKTRISEEGHQAERVLFFKTWSMLFE